MILPHRSLARTIAADAVNFKRLVKGCEAKVRCSLPNHCVDFTVVQFRHRPAIPANQELSGMWAARVRAPNERIEGIQAMDQVGLDQEIERPVNCRWCYLPASAIQAVKNIVSTDRFVAVPDQFQDPPALFRKAKSPLAADLHSRRNGLRHAVRVIVLFTRKLFSGIRLNHILCSYR